MILNIVRSLSFANLLILPFWILQGFLGTPFDKAFLLNRYHHEHDLINQFGHVTMGSAILLTIMLSAIAYPAVTRMETAIWARRTVVSLVVIGAIGTLNVIRINYLPELAFSKLLAFDNLWPWVGFGGGLAAGWSLIKLRQHSILMARSVLEVLSPVVVVVTINCAVSINALRAPEADILAMNYSLRP
ncbi:hypothetical protein OAJ57_02875 [Alphaproteobacteria bacterium]|nr:hypothetical protein [Alphaproteobacteria bacterium]